ncbi:MAG: class I SAM-dependent methyltransferase [Bacteroidia bacterium]|nr:class I SAM-dependent methyltransferase [Bacteroidia bacterium]
MKDAEYLREIYNERFKEPLNKWTSEDLKNCTRISRQVIKWTKSRPDKTKKLLDVGCATGFYTKAFALAGFDSYGLDYSEVAISKASQLHPECHFIHMNGFNPEIDMKFDLIFCRGFSGCNTHIIQDVSEWSNKYIDLLLTGGKFVFSYSTDFTGTEGKEETVNWTKDEIGKYISQIRADFSGIYFYHRFGLFSRIYLILKKISSKKKIKENFYLIFTKE